MDFIELTDVIKDTHEDRVFKESFDLCGEQLAETIEAVRISVLKSGTNAFYANNAGSRSATNNPVLRSDLRRVYRSFRRNKARPISSIVKASAKISTEPVEPAFFVLGHTDLDADVRNLEGFIPVKEYSNSDKALPAEVGSCDQFRFILTALFDSWEAVGTSGTTYLSGGAIVSSSTAADVYPMIILGRDAYGIVPLQGEESVTPAVKNPAPIVGDPLGQKGFVSWKLYHTVAILNQLWMGRLECCATAVPA